MVGTQVSTSTAILTHRQAEVLAFVSKEITEKHLPPTRNEIAAHFGFRSANAAEEHLRALANKGMLHLIKGTSRGIRLPSVQVEPQGV